MKDTMLRSVGIVQGLGFRVCLGIRAGLKDILSIEEFASAFRSRLFASTRSTVKSKTPAKPDTLCNTLPVIDYDGPLS